MGSVYYEVRGEAPHDEYVFVMEELEGTGVATCIGVYFGVFNKDEFVDIIKRNGGKTNA